MGDRKRVCLSSSSFKTLSTEYYYVDKTLFIKDFLREKGGVNLITRPRRFGKSTILDMLQTFFEKTDEDSSVYFSDKKIWNEGESVTREQGKYPVVKLSFEYADRLKWSNTLSDVKHVIRKEFWRHEYLAKSAKADAGDREIFKLILDDKAEPEHYAKSLALLVRMLRSHFGEKVVVLVDEFDTPYRVGYSKGYYDDVKSFFSDFYASGLKGNDDLYFAVVMGVLRMSVEDIFPGFDDLKTDCMMDDRYRMHFGFTADEVKGTLAYFGYSRKFDEVTRWYRWYEYEDAEIYNTVSVLKYIDDECRAMSYLLDTSSNYLVSDTLTGITKKTAKRLVTLLQGGVVKSFVDEDATYLDLSDDSDKTMTLLLFWGYLSPAKRLPKQNPEDSDRFELKIPNIEVFCVFTNKIRDEYGTKVFDAIWGCIESEDAENLKREIRRDFLDDENIFDSGKDVFQDLYCRLCLGMCISKYDEYIVTAGGDGKGRYCLTFEPRDRSSAKPAAIVEIANLDEMDTRYLAYEANKALKKITKKGRESDFKERGMEKVIKVGMAFLGAYVSVAM